MSDLTRKQQSVLTFIERQLDAGHSAPTYRDIARQFGYASKTAAIDHVRALVAKGVLVAEEGKARSLRVAAKARSAAHKVIEIPLFGSIPAGFGQDREQEPDECVPVTVESIGFKPTRNTFALRVAGDSMIGKHICDGDIAVFEHGPEPRPGQVVAALIDRKNTLKTFVVKGGKPYLKAENPKYPDLIPSEELVIQGVFRALIRRSKE
jgi:repressor LexA